MDSDQALDRFQSHYAKRLILDQLGDEAEHMAEDFRVTDFFRNKYQSLIVDNREIIRGSHVLDVGSNLGQWATLCCLNGARAVTCLEPRRKYVDGLNRFAGAQGLPMVAVQGIHRDCASMGQRFDVVLLSAMVSQMPDVWDFFRELRGITEHVIIGHHITVNTLPDDACRIEPQHNLSHRNAVDLRDDGYLEDPEGVQYDWNSVSDPMARGRTFHWYYGVDFLKTVVRHLGYEVLRVKKHDNRLLFGDTVGADDGQTLYDLILRVKR